MFLNRFSTMFLFFIFVFLLSVEAWLPRDGFDLLNNTVSPGDRKRFLTASSKMRGVNLGALFVMEPWMASTEWQNMGCGDTKSEFDCVTLLGQNLANVRFQAHYDSWTTQADLQSMVNHGLNTIRVPVGYWMYESLVYADSEHFPQGGYQYLERLCGWASDLGLYIIIELHGAPGAQVALQPFTGQNAPSAGFYEWWQYNRAEAFFTWLTPLIHNKHAFRNVGMIGVLNEPISNQPTLVTDYYPAVYQAIRAAETALGISKQNSLHVQFMNEQWGSGMPTASLPNDTFFIAYDDHRYTKYDTSVAVTQAAYIRDSCTNNRGTNDGSPTIVGEFSLSVPDDVQWTSGWDTTQTAFYSRWFASQIKGFEASTGSIGWTFWSWKAQLGDYRWSYQDAVAAGIIPASLLHLNTVVC